MNQFCGFLFWTIYCQYKNKSSKFGLKVLTVLERNLYSLYSLHICLCLSKTYCQPEILLGTSWPRNTTISTSRGCCQRDIEKIRYQLNRFGIPLYLRNSLDNCRRKRKKRPRMRRRRRKRRSKRRRKRRQRSRKRRRGRKKRKRVLFMANYQSKSFLGKGFNE